jgi:hypothetical protein
MVICCCVVEKLQLGLGCAAVKLLLLPVPISNASMRCARPPRSMLCLMGWHPTRDAAAAPVAHAQSWLMSRAADCAGVSRLRSDKNHKQQQWQTHSA